MTEELGINLGLCSLYLLTIFTLKLKYAERCMPTNPDDPTFQQLTQLRQPAAAQTAAASCWHQTKRPAATAHIQTSEAHNQ